MAVDGKLDGILNTTFEEYNVCLSPERLVDVSVYGERLEFHLGQ